MRNLRLPRLLLASLAGLSTLGGCATPGGGAPPFESEMSFRLMLYG